jgi:hypothetical protein
MKTEILCKLNANVVHLLLYNKTPSAGKEKLKLKEIRK